MHLRISVILLIFCCWIHAATPAVLPHFAMGGGWYSALYFTNGNDAPANFQVSFFGENGQPMPVPRPGLDPAAVHSVNLPARGTARIETPNSGPLLQGWAMADLPTGVTGYAVFRQIVAGRPDQEAVVPLTGISSRSATLLWDNTEGLVSTVGVLNPSSFATTVRVTARNEAGQILGTAQIPLEAKKKTAFILSNQSGLAGLIGQRGTADFTVASPGSVAVLGLRFKDAAFTSIPPAVDLVNPDSTPAPIPAPSLQASPLSANQVRLSWTNTATGVVRYRLERRNGGGGAFTEIAQPNAAATSYDDAAIATATVYSYRIRVETSAGFSAYSNEVAVTTSGGLPAAPTNLQGAATSSSQANLTWTNNAPDATAIRVESRQVGSATFTDIGAGATLTSTGITGLLPSMSYTFRVRAQNVAGYSPYSNEVSITTLPVAKTVFLIHGLNQHPTDLRSLATNLAASYGLSAGRFTIDYGFDFSACAGASPAFCSSNCTISGGAQQLAQYIVNANPPGDIVLVGFSMGGLIARDLIVNNRIILNGRKIHLVTIATPNLGYPYLLTDGAVFCNALVSAMYGDWRAKPNTVDLSDYLLSTTNQWSAAGFPGTGRTWFTASGRACSVPTRLGRGCRDQNPYSDGVVCQDSAAYSVNTAIGTTPSSSWSDPGGVYVHSYSGFTSFILCDTSDHTRYLPLWNPPPTGALFTTLTAILNGL